MRTLTLTTILLALAGCAKPTPPTPAGPVQLHFALINDFHGALYEQAMKDDAATALGGLPWLVGAVDTLRAEHPDLIVIDGGDLFQGSWPVNQSNGMGSVSAFELMKVDAAAVGNHEFDYGGGPGRRERLEAAAKAADFEWLTANVEHDGQPWQPEGIRPWTMIERGGVKIGVIGLTTMDTPTTTTTANVADLKFLDPVETVRRLAPEVRAAGAQVLVVTGHLTGRCKEPATGYGGPPPTCLPDGELGRLLTELPRGTIDLLVAGHAHTLMAHRWDDTFVVEDRAEGTVIGRVDLVVNPDGTVDRDASQIQAPWVLSHPPVDPRCEPGEYDLTPRELGGRLVTPSAPALELVRALETSAGSLCQEVGCAAAPLGRTREKESGAGDAVADLMLGAFPNADLAVQNSGGLRADLPGGKLRREHLQAVMPFQNTLLEVELSGAQLLTLLRIGSSGAHGVLQVSGASYRFDPAKTGGTDLNADGQVEAWETDRLCWAKVRGKPIDPAATYKVVTTDFLLGGGDHLGAAFAGAKVVSDGGLLRDALFRGVEARTECLPALPDAAAPRIEQGACP